MSTTVVITALICLVAGAVIGMLLSRLTNPEQQKVRELESKLQQAENSLKDYQQEVTEHFIQTSGLINNLTQSYKAVHEHMASSAMHLANPDISRQLVNAGTGKLTDNSSEPLAGTPPEPPKDYAPKAPGGVLSEEYGLKDDYGIEARPGHQVANDENDNEDDPTLKAV
ncbi:YhcB family protein [Porticoccus sp. GXU_MW_L64]